MSEFKKEKHNPIELIKKFWANASVDHITYDPSLIKGDYSIIRQCRGDGTLIFTIDMLKDGLLNIANMSSYFKPDNPDFSRIKQINYTVGTVRHVTVYGMIKLGVSENREYYGQKERIRIPIKCEYVYV